MRALVYSKYGPPELAELMEVNKPIPKDNEVLIKVRATTVNHTDCAFRSAEYFINRFFSGLLKPTNKILGNEFAGEIEAKDKYVTLFNIGAGGKLMRKVLTTTILLIIQSLFAFGQIDTTLSKTIDSLAFEDQKWRGLIRHINNNEIDTISKEIVSFYLRLTDSLNLIEIKRLFEEYGFLGYDKVGKSSSKNFWLLVQHADKNPEFQLEVLKSMKLAADSANASLIDFAYLIDRVKVNTGQLQIFGTQMQLNDNKTSYEPKPLLDTENVNLKRKEVGLNTIEEYIKIMNDRYYGTITK